MRIPDPFEADNSHLIIFLIEHPNIESRIFFEVKQLPNTCKSEMIDTGSCSILCNLKSPEHHATIHVVTVCKGLNVASGYLHLHNIE